MNTIIGFNNSTGSICWLNSLLQALISIKCLCHYLQNRNIDNCSKIEKELIKLINDPNENSSLNILKTFALELRKNNKSIDILIGQQSVSEGLILILELINNKDIDKLFNHTYEKVIICNDTQKIVSTNRQINNIFYLWDYGEHNILENNITELLLLYINTLDKNYKPKEHNNEQTYSEIYKLKKIPQIVIMALNRYGIRNSRIKLPNTFTIPSNKNMDFVYKKIAEIDQLGTLHSGHYICRAERDGKIYMFNDASVSDHKFGTISSTYLTFYERE